MSEPRYTRQNAPANAISASSPRYSLGYRGPLRSCSEFGIAASSSLPEFALSCLYTTRRDMDEHPTRKDACTLLISSDVTQPSTAEGEREHTLFGLHDTDGEASAHVTTFERCVKITTGYADRPTFALPGANILFIRALGHPHSQSSSAPNLLQTVYSSRISIPPVLFTVVGRAKSTCALVAPRMRSIAISCYA